MSNTDLFWISLYWMIGSAIAVLAVWVLIGWVLNIDWHRVWERLLELKSNIFQLALIAVLTIVTSLIINHIR